jgi:hypothetical protein
VSQVPRTSNRIPDTVLIASTDIETTGLDPETCQVLELGVVLWETTDFVTPVAELPAFHCYVVHPSYRGDAYALAMNRAILWRIAEREPGSRYLDAIDVGSALADFIYEFAPRALKETRQGDSYAELWPAGFNFDGFDRQFLRRLPEFSRDVRFTHRSLAPATLFFDPMVDAKIPGSDEVFRRAGVDLDEGVRHTALGDARAVVEVLRAGYGRAGQCIRPASCPSGPESGFMCVRRDPASHAPVAVPACSLN